MEAVVGKVAHFLEVAGFFVFKSEALVKEAAADADGDGEAVGAECFAEQAAACGGEFFVAVLVFAALGEEFDAGGEGAEEVFELFGVFGGDIEGAHDAEELVRGSDAGLVGAVAGVGLRGVFVVAGLGGGFALLFAGKPACRAGCACGEDGFEQGAFGWLGGLWVVVLAHSGVLCGGFGLR